MSQPPRARVRRPTPRPAEARGVQPSKSEGQTPHTVELLGAGRVTLDAGASTDTRILAIAERQRGRVARRQLLSAGVSSAAIDRRLASGRIVLVHSAVYALPHTAGLALAPETAALLAWSERAVLSHHSAATLWGLRPGVARPVHVTIPHERGRPRLAAVVVHRSRTLTRADIRLHQDLPVTAPARTLLDLAATLPDRDLERLVDEALFARRLITRAQLDDLLRRAGRHPGRWRLARAAAAHTHSTPTDSPPEERLLRMIRAAGLPEPRLQVPMLGYRLDLYWPELSLAVELDVYGTHGSPARFEADRRRDARLLTERGVAVVRLTKTAIETRPLETIASLAGAVAQRRAELRLLLPSR